MLSTPQPPISIGIAILVVPVGIFVGTWIVAGIAEVLGDDGAGVCAIIAFGGIVVALLGVVATLISGIEGLILVVLGVAIAVIAWFTSYLFGGP